MRRRASEFPRVGTALGGRGRSERPRSRAGAAGARVPQRALPAVTVSRPVEQPVTEYLEMTGTVAASKTVNLVARVPGYLESVNFKDGDVVREGQLLFVIEQPPYVEQVKLNEAALVRAQAELDRPGSHDEGERDGADDCRELGQPAGPGEGAARAREDQPRLHEGHRSLHRPDRRAAGRPGKSRRVERADDARDPGSDAAHLRELQPERARRAPHARPDEPAQHRGRSRASARSRSRSASRTRTAIPTWAFSTSPTTA